MFKKTEYQISWQPNGKGSALSVPWASVTPGQGTKITQARWQGEKRRLDVNSVLRENQTR